eukprot:7595522-Pyramimonas_sp.AAC.1
MARPAQGVGGTRAEIVRACRAAAGLRGGLRGTTGAFFRPVQSGPGSWAQHVAVINSGKKRAH